MLVLIVGNIVTGFHGYRLPADLTPDDATRLMCHVPESRLITVGSLEDCIDKYGAPAKPANIEPKTKPVDLEEKSDDAGGPADDADNDASDGDSDATDPSAPEQN